MQIKSKREQMEYSRRLIEQAKKKPLHEWTDEEFMEAVLEGLREAAREAKKGHPKRFDINIEKGEYFIDPGDMD